MASFCRSRFLVFFPRQMSTSVPRRVSASPSAVREIGRLTPAVVDSVYSPGQMFIHKTFAYRGVIVCSFNCRFNERKENSTEKTSSNRDYYQVLVHRPDWAHMLFPVDLTCYLQEGSTRGEKYLAVINGMDCPSHADIIPYETNELSPIDHDLFDRIFMREEGAGGKIVMRPQLKDNYMASQRSWLAPRDVYREVTEGIEVTVSTFYLGTNLVNSQPRHMWRYSIRIENHVPQKAVILRERSLKIYSLNNMNQANGHGVVGKVGNCLWNFPFLSPMHGDIPFQQPELNVSTPAFQFSSTIELPHSKGGHMWGTFKMERDNGSTFNVTIPTVVLESQDEKVVEMEKAKE